MSTPLKYFFRRLSASQMRAPFGPQIQSQLQARPRAGAHHPGAILMGATVVTGKTVAAFRHPKTGEVIYLAFEETFEKNVYPHTPSWSPRAIGTFEQVMKVVYGSAAACEGGGLQIRSGHTKPETYLKSWRLCFSEPFQMDDQEITLKLGGDSLYAPIPDKHVDTALATLERIGRHDLADALKSGSTVTVSLHRDPDVVLSLYGVDTELSLWKVIRGKHGLGHADETLAPAIAKRDVDMPTAVVYAVDDENVVVSINGGVLKHMGWRYSAVGQYIRNVALPIELQRSFSVYKLIREFRDTCDAAPELPDSTIIAVTPAKGEHSYYVENAKKLAVKLGMFPSVEHVPETYETTFGIVRERSEEYILSTLESEQVTWTLAPDVDSAALHGVCKVDQPHQLGLF
jgi:hypothetical protein